MNISHILKKICPVRDNISVADEIISKTGSRIGTTYYNNIQYRGTNFKQPPNFPVYICAIWQNVLSYAYIWLSIIVMVI